MKKSKTFLIAGLSFFCALVLAFLPLPVSVEWLRPQWIILVLMAWCLVAPEFINVGTAFLIGLLLDIPSGVPLGESSFALVLVAYIAAKFGQKILRLNFWQSEIAVFGLVILGQLSLDGKFWMWVSRALISAIIWPVVLKIIRVNFENLCRKNSALD